MAGPTEDRYFLWLTCKVRDSRSRLYEELLKMLHAHEFTWDILGDENRSEDGLELREYFCMESGANPFDDSGCSVLEMLIALADRCSFQTSVSSKRWFWIFIENLGLSELRHSRFDHAVVDEIIAMFVGRTYSADGEGGLFPLRWTEIDQRRQELWFQFFEYLGEDEPT